MFGEAAAASEKRELGYSLPGQHFHAEHRRSRSASDRNFSVSRGDLLRSTKKDHNDTQVLPPSTSGSQAQSPVHDDSTRFKKACSSNHRASLEKDIELLQLCLQQEKSVRIMLERAMGRPSSTLSPGHSHAPAQTKELIAEIELLEEEVASREQHVLSLYRSIFEHCVSGPPSEQNSGMASPAHSKNETRKHPSIISSAFCSSKKYPRKSLRALVSKNGSGSRASSARNASLSGGKGNIDFAMTCLGDGHVTKVKVPAMGKSSLLQTLKDHLQHQCPSKLSEEMVRCMAAVYFCLHRSALVSRRKRQSPSLSRPSTGVTQARDGKGEDQVRGGGLWKEMVEISIEDISWMSTNKSQFSHASYLINNYRVLVEQLERVNVSKMEIRAQTAFWINVYNALVMHAYLAYGVPHSSLRRLALFRKAAYNIGGHIISANVIEQSVFCLRSPKIGWWLETIISTALRKKHGEERHLLASKLNLPILQPLVCFALCTGILSDPLLRVYTASNIREELEVAKREFLQANIVVKKSRKIFLPKLLEKYSREASVSCDDLLKWVSENVDDKKLRDSIQKCVYRKSCKKASQMVEWLPYSSRFRYVISKDLTEKPWWP